MLLPTDLQNSSFVKSYTIQKRQFEYIVKLISNISLDKRKKNFTKSIGITFDDGFISDYIIAYPILKQFGIQGTFFVNVKNIGLPGYCNMGQLSEMAKNGMKICSHGLRHKYLIQMTKNEAYQEMYESKLRLEDALSLEIDGYAPVGGHYKKWMVAAAEKIGYKLFATMIPGISNFYSNKFNIIKRNHIKRDYEQDYINKIISGNFKILFSSNIRYKILMTPKLIFGLEKYDKIKKKINSIRI